MSNSLETVESRPRTVLAPLTPPPLVPARQDRIDLRVAASTLKRRWGLFLAVLVVCIAIGAIVTLKQKPVYSASAQVVIDLRQPEVAPNTQVAVPTPTPDVVATEVIVLKSRSLADAVAEALHLDGDPTFAGTAPTAEGLFPRIKRILGLGRPLVGPRDAHAIRQQVIDTLEAGLSVARIDETFALQINYANGNPVMAARIANEFALQYTHGQLSRKAAENQTTSGLLAERMEGLRQQAQRDTDQVERYRIAHNLLSTTGASLTEQEITSYNEQVASARAAAAEDQARLDTARAQLRAGSSGGDVGAALDSPVVSALRSRRAEVGGRYANLSAHYGPLHPDVIKAKSELADIDAQIAAEIGRVISNLEARAKVSRERLASLTSSLSGAKGTLADNARSAVGLDDLQRRATTSQALYESYLNRYKETGAREGTEHADARIVSLAEVPGAPSSPHPTLTMMLATALGVVFGLAAAFGAEMMFAGLTTGEDVEQRLGQNALGVVPAIRSVQPRMASPLAAVVETPTGPFAESIRSLRRAIQFAVDGPAQLIAVTSALPKEGKTTIALCLARSIAIGGERVILVDCDLRQRGATRAVNAEGERPGLVEVLRGVATLEEALLMDEASGALLLPQPSVPGDVGDLLVGPAMDELLAQLRLVFGKVILDTAPSLPVADTRIIAGKVDAVVFVARWRKTSDHAIRAALQLLPPRLVTIAGVVLSRVDMRRQGRYGYGDASFYYREYKGYYG